MVPEGMRRVMVPVCIALLIGLVFAGCLAPTQGTVAVYLKAQPSDEFLSVDVTVTRVEVQRAGADIGDGPDSTVPRGAGEEPNAGQMGFRAISTSRTSVDLLEYQEPTSRALLGAQQIPEGGYSLVVVRLAEEVQGVLRADESSVGITLTTREIRHNVDFAVEAGESTRIIIELDLEGGISQDDEGNYRMSPRVADVVVQPRADGPEADSPDRGV